MKLFLLLFICLSISCTSSKLLQSESHEPLVVKLLEGSYSNQPIDSASGKKRFSDHYKPFDNVDSSDIINPHLVTITILSPRKIRFTESYLQSQTVDYDFKYKIKNNVLVIHGFSNYEQKGVPLLFYRYEYQTLNLALTTKGNLLIGANGEAAKGKARVSCMEGLSRNEA